MFQVNVRHYMEGGIHADIRPHSENSYVGRLTDAVYLDGCDYTDWCVFVGSRKECEDYAKSF